MRAKCVHGMFLPLITVVQVRNQSHDAKSGQDIRRSYFLALCWACHLLLDCLWEQRTPAVFPLPTLSYRIHTPHRNPTNKAKQKYNQTSKAKQNKIIIKKKAKSKIQTNQRNKKKWKTGHSCIELHQRGFYSFAWRETALHWMPLLGNAYGLSFWSALTSSDQWELFPPTKPQLCSWNYQYQARKAASQWGKQL